MNAFDPGRVGLWVNSPANLFPLNTIAGVAGGMFPDVFLPRAATAADMTKVRNTTRPDGSKLKAQLYEIPLSSDTPEQFAQRVSDDIVRLAPGVVELDIERKDSELPGFIHDTVASLRARRPSFLFRVNVEPFKGWALPIDLLQTDPNLYAAEQTYFGDMSRVSESDVLSDLVGRGVPWSKATICYGAAGPTDLSGSRGITLPNVLYQGHFSGRKLSGGMVFTDDLLAEKGLI